MKSLMRFTLVLVLAAGATTALGQMASPDDALNVAENWIAMHLHDAGHWGAFEEAQILDVQEFSRGDRLLGYCCDVAPVGYIVVSLRQELPPVKAYSTYSALDPGFDEGMTDLLKTCMERVLDAIEQELGPIEAVQTQDLVPLLEMEYRQSWDVLNVPPTVFRDALERGQARTNYQEGEVLLLSHWSQPPPYNDDCPDMGCSWPNQGYYNTNALVGCVATAGSQIMRHWNWPPYGVDSPYNDTYDWVNMLNMYIWDDSDSRFEDEDGNPVTSAQIDAVAELGSEVGIAVAMDYGCSGSGAWTYDMEGVYEDHYRYSTACVKRDRPDYTADEWFDRVKAQCNVNRPMHYRIPGHSIVADGWQEVSAGDGLVKQYHINYGWGLLGTCNGCDTWYTLDSIYGGKPDDEYMLENIVPSVALGDTVSGTYVLGSFPYLYVDQDATGSNAQFNAGFRIQFLPAVTVQCTGSGSDSIRFYGSATDYTRLYTRGNTAVGARIRDACIKLYGGGTIVLR